MAPIQLPSLSPSELSYLHTSLSQTPSIRPDGRSATQFRPLVAETDILPSTNGSARICFADGTEAVVGVKAEVEKVNEVRDVVQMPASGEISSAGARRLGKGGDGANDEHAEEDKLGKGRDRWLDVAIDIPGYRDDDALPVFLGAMLTEALLADGRLKDTLYINSRFHWRLYIDVLLLSPPLSYPLPLLSLTTHLALLCTRLPALISERDEDPLFNDDWDAAVPLYPSVSSSPSKPHPKPPITLLVMTVADNVIFDPSRDELAVADCVFAISVGASSDKGTDSHLNILAIRTIDPPSRLTASGTPNSLNSATGGTAPASAAEALALRERSLIDEQGSVWRTPRGGVRRGLVGRLLNLVVAKGGVADEVLDALAAVEG